jgi:hypothetical protein
MNERLQERINLYVKPKKKEKEKKNVCCSRHQDIDIVCRRHLAKLKYKKKDRCDNHLYERVRIMMSFPSLFLLLER